MQLDSFIERFNGFTEPYFFYDGTIELRYEPKGHVYYRIIDGEFVAQDGVTSVVHIIDKSEALIPWACKMMAGKLLATTPVMQTPTGEKIIPQMSYEDFEKLVLEAKKAHKEKLDEASSVGHAAHNWIEHYIKAILAGELWRVQFLMGNMPEEQRARNCCTAALDWMQQHKVRWVCTERKIYSRQYMYAGTLDGKAYVSSCGNPRCCADSFTDRLSVIDWKSSNYLYLEYRLQTAGYQWAQEEELDELIEDRWIIRLGKDDGEFDPWHLDRSAYAQDLDAFLAALKLTRVMRDLKEDLKERTNVIKAERKAQVQREKEEALKIKCKGADKYKGVRPPRCNSGNPCQSCVAKYAANQPVAVTVGEHADFLINNQSGMDLTVEGEQ